MNTETMQTAARIVAPIGGDLFDGTLDEATDAMVAFAAEVRIQDGADAQSALARVMAHSDADRVAKVAAAALLRLAEQSKPAHDTSQPTPPFPLAEGDTVTVTMPARVAGLPDPEADPGAADELWDFAITVAGETEYVSLTQAEVIARVRKQ